MAGRTTIATTKDVARALGVSPQRVRQYAADARIPFRRTPGGHRRYDIGAVRAALAALARLREGPERTRLLADIAAAVRDVEPGARVLLFGSRARGDARPDSDWDVAVIVEGALTPERRSAILRSVLHRVELTDDSFPVITPLVFDRAAWDRRLEAPGLVADIARDGVEL